ncbi:hypothetical protein LEP1GSC086_0535 [Leptospira weilii str. LNT 1234]|nr:hypothetical protein LEP1GSC086_0535 [Leptospira weilii str. LNT 1234]
MKSVFYRNLKNALTLTLFFFRKFLFVFGVLSNASIFSRSACYVLSENRFGPNKLYTQQLLARNF